MRRFVPAQCLRAVVFCVPAVLLAPLGCGHEVTSPEPSAASGPASPDVVCVEQLTTKVTLTGDGFTPMPIQTLQNKQELALPTVTLTLEGADGGGGGDDGGGVGAPVTVPDDPSNPDASDVSWTSEQQMAFEVTPAETLSPGLYDVTVTNPDGTHQVTFPGAFAGVPRPHIASAAADIECDAQTDQTVTLTGTGFLQVGSALPVVHATDGSVSKDIPVDAVSNCTDVPGMHSAGKVQSCTTATFTVKAGTFPPTAPGAPTQLDLTLTNPQRAACTSTDKISITIVPPPSVASIVPDPICDAQGDVTETITGAGFLQIGKSLPTVTVNGTMVPATAVGNCTNVMGTFTEMPVETCTTATFTVKEGSIPTPMGMPTDAAIVVTNPAPAACHSTESLTLHVVPPPSVAKIVADLVCDAEGDQKMTLDGNGFLEIGTTLPSIAVGTQTFSPTGISDCTMVQGTPQPTQECKTLDFTIPKGTFMPGDYAVVVTNPSAPGSGGMGACKSTDAINLHVAPPPDVTSMGLSACDAEMNASVTVMGTGFLEVGGGMDGGETLPTVEINGMAYIPTSAGGCTPVTTAPPLAEAPVSECTSLTVTIPKGTLTPGMYPVTVTNPLPANCASTQMVQLTIVGPPTVSSVAPASICVGGGSLTITGTGFAGTPTVQLEPQGGADAGAPLDCTNVMVNTAGTSLTCSVGAGGIAGDTYDVVVTNADGCSELPPYPTVNVVPGPVLFFASPQTVYNGINTVVTLYTTANLQPPITASMTPSGGGTAIPLTIVQTTPHVQVVIPQGTAVGAYDVTVTDGTGCPATLASAITVTATTTITIKQVVPPFGQQNTTTAIEIDRDTTAPAPNDTPFNAVPTAFLNPSGNTTNPAIQLRATTFVDSATLDSIVPASAATTVGSYDLVIVNPTGEVGVLANAFSVTQNAPPTITSVAPLAVVQNTAAPIVIDGTNFRGTPPVLSVVSCADATGAPIPTPTATITASGNPTCSAQQVCTQNATINLGTVLGSTCVIQLKNPDGTYAIFSAIAVTNASGNIASPRAGSKMTTGRRALVGAAANATSVARFVYAIGGDDATNVATPFSSVESVPVDLFGNMKTWSAQPYGLGAGRSFAAGVTVGNYIYLCGGTDGTSFLSSCQRAMVLNPLEAPSLDISDIEVKPTGVAAGFWYYRVSATFASTDPDNPGGESLPSDEIAVNLSNLPTGQLAQITLSWTAPVDSTGAPLPNVTGYRVYRTAMANGTPSTEVLLTTVTGLQYTDDGSATPGTATALPLGSTGQWAAIPSMLSGREGLAMSYGFDPTLPSTFYVYSFYGKSNATTALGTYEHLPVTINPNGHQTVGAVWTAGVATSANPRWQVGAWHVDPSIFSGITSGTYLYVGPGLKGAGTSDGTVEGWTVGTGGDLGTPASEASVSGGVAGYGVMAGASQLFALGGQGAAPSSKIDHNTLAASQPGLTQPAWNANGVGLLDTLYLPGVGIQSSFAFVLGGETAAGPPAVATTDTEISTF